MPRHFTTPAKITAGVAVVGLGVGIGFGLETRSRYNACEAMLETLRGRARRDKIRNVALIADLGFVVALGAAVATVVLYMTSGKESRLIVTPTTEGAAVSAFGRF